MHALPPCKLCNGIDGVSAMALSTLGLRHHQRTQQSLLVEPDYADKGEWLVLMVPKCENTVRCLHLDR